MDISQTFGKILRRRRKEAGLSQEQLALEAGIQRNYVSLIERGINQPTIGMLYKLANALQLSPMELVADIEAQLVSEADFHERIRRAELSGIRSYESPLKRI